MRKRVFEYDIIRTIATYSVVFVHISAIAIGLYLQNSWQGNMMIFFNRMLKFTTPIFIFLAGALIFESVKAKPFRYFKFVKGKFTRILVPYVLVSTMYFVLISILSKQAMNPVALGKQIIAGSAQYHLYFIPIIIQLYLLTPVFLYLKDKFKLKHLMIVMTVISYLSVLFLKFNFSDRIFIKFIVPYAIGLYFGSDIMIWLRSLGKKVYALLLATFLAGFYYFFTFSSFFKIQEYSVLEKFRDTGWFFYCIMSIFLLMFIAMKLVEIEPVKKLSGICSKISYYIYLLHPLFIYLVEKLLDRLGVVSVSLRFLLTLIIVIVVSTAVAYLIKGIGWKKKYNMLNRVQKVALICIVLILGGSSIVYAYGELMDRGYVSSVDSVINTQRVKKIAESHDKSSQLYENEKFGFTYSYTGFEVDDSNEVIKTSFYNDDTVVDVYYENLIGTIHSSMPFTIYGNRSIVDGKYVEVSNDTWLKHGEYQVHLLEWERDALKHVKDDKTHYVSIDVIKNDMEIYNVMVKSAESIDALSYLGRLKIIEIDESAVVKQKQFHRMENSYWNEMTKNYFNEAFIESKTLTWGIFEPSTIRGLEPLNEFEETINYDFNYLLQYYNLNSYISDDNIQSIYDQGKVLEFTLQTSVYGEYNQDATLDVLNGIYDEDLDRIVDHVSRIDGPVLFRLNNEMNGDWCFYNAFWYQKDTELYKELWTYIYRKFEEASADNIIWVFNPNESSFPGFKWNHYSNYFPGEKYVDIIGVTGYNTGNYYEGEIWRGFEEIYDEFMPEYEFVFNDYPMMITEFGSSSIGGDKALWLDEMFDVINKYDLKAAIYWNSIDYTPEKEKARIYKFDDDPIMVEVFKRRLNAQ